MRRPFVCIIILFAGCDTAVYVPGGGSSAGEPQTRLGSNDRLRNACSIGDWTLDDGAIESALAQADALREEGYTKSQIIDNSQLVCTYECQVSCYGSNGGNCPGDEDSQCKNYCDHCIDAIVSQVFR